MKKIVLIFLVVGLVFCGCDTGNDTNDFKSTVNNTVQNDVPTLGLVGTSVSSSNEGVATVEIASWKIKITSVSAGTAVITVSEGLNNATINITVSSTGSILIETIEKYSVQNNTDPKKVVIQNLTENGACIILISTASGNIVKLFKDNIFAIGFTHVSGNTGTFDLKIGTDETGPTEVDYTGIGEFYIAIGFDPTPSYVSKNRITIDQSITIVEFNMDDWEPIDLD